MTVGRSRVDEMSRPTSASAALSRVRRWISSNSRAFSSATPMLDATVVSNRSSDSPKACSRTKFDMLRMPSTRSLPMTGTAAIDCSGSVPGIVVVPAASISAMVFHTTSRRVLTMVSHAARGRRLRREFQALPALIEVKVVDEAGLGLHPPNGDVVASEHLAHLVAHEVHDGL